MNIVDNTMLHDLMSCERQAVVKHVHHWKTKEAAVQLKAGQAIHSAIALLMKGGTCENAVDWFTAEYKQWALDNPSSDDRYDYANLVDIVETWVRWFKATTHNFTVRPDLVELGVQATLPNGLEYYALLDAVVEVPAGYYVFETKTTKALTSWFEGRWKLASQLTGQVWAANASKRFDKPVLGVLINPVPLKPLPKRGRKCAKHKVDQAECRHLAEHTKFGMVGPFLRNEKVIGAWIKEAMTGASWYHEGRSRAMAASGLSLQGELDASGVQGMFNGACQFCELAEWCTQGANTQMLPAKFVQQVWDPRERALSV